MSIERYWYLRSARDLMDAHLAVPSTALDGTVESVCGATFTPVAVFNYGSRDATEPPDPRVCADYQILQAALPDSQRTSS